METKTQPSQELQAIHQKLKTESCMGVKKVNLKDIFTDETNKEVKPIIQEYFYSLGLGKISEFKIENNVLTFSFRWSEYYTAERNYKILA